MLGVQFTLMQLVDPWQPWAGLAVAAIGLGLVILGITRQREEPQAPAG